jgi:RNA polymerase sigma factor (sigma-70 family)
MKKLPDELMSYWVKKVPPKIDFIFSESFVKKNKFDKPNTDLPKPYGEHIVFSIEQERELFIRFNYAKYRATKVTDSKNIRIWLTEAAYYKEIIAYHNIPLCYSWIGKLRDVDLRTDELRSEIFYSLNHAIDKFDINKDRKFSTYFVMVMKSFVFTKIRDLKKHCNNSSLDAFDGDAVDIRSGCGISQVDAAIDIQTIFSRNKKIDSRERLILNKLFGLHGKEQMGLNNVAKEFGVSKQRINSLKQRTFQKIRDRFEQATREHEILNR